MNNFIIEVLKKNEFATYLFDCSEMYKGSNYESDMPNFYDWEDKITVFLSKNTEWIYIDDEGNLYGLIKHFVIKSDSEGQFEYFCTGFENIPLFRFEELERLHMLKGMKEHWLKDENIDLDNLLERYNEFCKAFNLKTSLSYDETEFKKFIGENVK